MSYSHSKPISFGNAFTSNDTITALDHSLPFVQSADRAIDNALRGVPLPDGFLGRLKQLVGGMTDELSGPVGYAGR